MLVQRSNEMDEQAYSVALIKSVDDLDMTAALCMRTWCLSSLAQPNMLQAALLTSIMLGRSLLDLYIEKSERSQNKEDPGTPKYWRAQR